MSNANQHSPFPWHFTEPYNMSGTLVTYIHGADGYHIAQTRHTDKETGRLEADLQILKCVNAIPMVIGAIKDTISKIDDVSAGKIKFHRDIALRLRVAFNEFVPQTLIDEESRMSKIDVKLCDFVDGMRNIFQQAFNPGNLSEDELKAVLKLIENYLGYSKVIDEPGNWAHVCDYRCNCGDGHHAWPSPHPNQFKD